MTRAEVRTFIHDGVNDLAPIPTFVEGQISDFAALPSTDYPAVLSTLEETKTDILVSAPLDRWPIILYIVFIDKMDSNPEVYEDLVDQADLIAQKLIYKYRNIVEGYKLVQIGSVSREKLVKSPKMGPDVLTGVMLSFDLIAPDKTNVC